MTNLIAHIGQRYDELPYTSAAFPDATPEHLRAVARLFALDAPPAEDARVLELGCSAGGNLIPFAVRNPRAQAVGVDLSSIQVRAGQRAIEAMGLDNVRLVHASITDLDESLGQFDYIVCHGVYSWVPDEVRQAILWVCGSLLAPNGVAMVSYNTYPGWKAKEIVRDAMRLRGGARESVAEQLAYGRGMIEFLHEKAPGDSVLAKVMGEFIDTVRNGQDQYLAHEYMEPCNAPCYLRDFVASARSHGLEYLGDAVVGTMFASSCGDAAQALLNESGGDQVMLEQLMDFLRNRTFRSTLLVRSEQGRGIRYATTEECLAGLHVAGPYQQADEAGERWQANKREIIARTDVARTVLATIGRAWPATVPVQSLLYGLDGDAAIAVRSFIGNLIGSGTARFRCEAVAAPAVGPRPVVREALRRLVALGEPMVHPFTEWHTSVALDSLDRVLIPHMDGNADEAALVAIAADAVRAGTLSLSRGDQPLTDPDDIVASLSTFVRRSLGRMTGNALLAPVEAPGTACAGKPGRKARK